MRVSILKKDRILEQGSTCFEDAGYSHGLGAQL
jgi:hypothetical protein